MQNSYDQTERETKGKKKPPLAFILGDSMVKDIKGWKMSRRTCKILVQKLST